MLKRVLKLLDSNKLNDLQLEQEIGLKKGTIYNWKSERGKPSTDAIIKIASL